MNKLIDQISDFLQEEGFKTGRNCCKGFDFLKVDGRIIIPVEISRDGMEDATNRSQALSEAVDEICQNEDYPMIISQDRWNCQRPMIQARLLAHLDRFTHVFARNCEIRRIDKACAATFLNANHSYGDAACKYRYGLFLKRHTGKYSDSGLEAGTLVAVATFSNARKWKKEDKVISSYEWTRYASLPEVRVNGGMGKLLQAFIDEIKPDDIMSYADLEWSEGKVYETLGFIMETHKNKVMFAIGEDWKRRAIKDPEGENAAKFSCRGFLCNLGSNKYRLKLTDYR